MNTPNTGCIGIPGQMGFLVYRHLEKCRSLTELMAQTQKLTAMVARGNGDGCSTGLDEENEVLGFTEELLMLSGVVSIQQQG